MDAVLNNPHSWVLGASAQSHGMIRTIARIAATQCSALIVGPTGSGKEIIARLIHSSGPRADQTFLPANCPALAPSLFETLVFGHRKGAFTGADRDVQGVLAGANKGILFLDEIGELEISQQPKLLRALETQGFQRIGENEPTRVDVQVLCATNRDLEQEVSQNRFRQDLLYRLGIITVQVPPLRERTADISMFVDYFASLHAAKYKMPVKRIDGPTLERLRQYPWPGNIRELSHVIEKAYVLDVLIQAPDQRKPVGRITLPSLNLKWLRTEALDQALKLTRGNQRDAARLLGVCRGTVALMLRHHKVRAGAPCHETVQS